MERKKILLVSLDALGESDLEYLKKLPNFAKIMKQGAWCPHECSVYPSLTFPSHASIATGCVPNSHRVVNNYQFLPFEEHQKWNSYASALKRKAIWDYAAENGKKVLSLSWPVSGGAKMTYSMPELSPAKPREWNTRTFFAQLNMMRKYGTPGFAIRTMLSRRELPKAWFYGKQPDLDQAMIHCFEHAIEKEDFDIAMLHIYGLDDEKHQVGIAGGKIHGYLRAYDRFVGRLMEYCDRRQAQDENVTLMVTGDHGQKDVTYAIHGNMALQDMGYSTYQDGFLKEYQVYMDGCDGMAYLYPRNAESGDDREACRVAAEYFKTVPGVKAVMEREEFAPCGCDQKAEYVLEAANGYSFETGYEAEADKEHHYTVVSHYKGLHGYLPDEDGYRTVFFSYGKDVRAKTIDKMCITDILPTMLTWLGITPDADMDGKAVKGVWKETDA